MIEHHRPLGLQVLIELHTVPCTRKQLPQRCLAPFERLASQIVAIEFDDVECPHEDARIVAPVSDPVEQRDAIVPAGDRLAIDDARARAQARQPLDDQREALREVVTWAAEQLDALVLFPGDDPEEDDESALGWRPTQRLTAQNHPDLAATAETEKSSSREVFPPTSSIAVSSRRDDPSKRAFSSIDNDR